MKKRLLILAAVLAAVALVLWLKRENTPRAFSGEPAQTVETRRATALLFADPREAEGSCGCAEITHMVRELRGTLGVDVREIDSRSPGDDARRYEVRTSPTVILLDAAGNERGRFEGESSSTIASLRSALEALRRSLAAEPRRT